MKATIVIAHPYKNSFNHALCKRAQKTLLAADISVHLHDLYKDGFNPVLSEKELGKEPAKNRLVRKYTAEFMESDILVFIHPNWWGQPPAILKGYIDRIIRPPHAYDFPANDKGGGLPIGKLGGKTGIVINTSNTPGERENRYFHDPLEFIWKKCVFGFCGIKQMHRIIFRVMADSTHKQRVEWLKETEEMIKNIIRKLNRNPVVEKKPAAD